MNTEVMFSSKSDEWETPQDLFDKLNAEFSFTLDVCATPENAKCSAFYTEDDDGLKQDWQGNCWMNPPYGREIGKWIEKAAWAAKTTANLVVCLLPARTDTRWWHKWIWDTEQQKPYTGVKVRFIKGRLKFGGCSNSAPFPSAIVIFAVV